jgi:hypothetical protein
MSNHERARATDRVDPADPAPLAVGDRDAATWLELDDGMSVQGINTACVIAAFALKTGSDVQLIDVSQGDADPGVMIVQTLPRISRGRSPQGTILSPLELFTALARDRTPPSVLRRHHDYLARRGVFGPQPRVLAAPLWATPDFGDLPPEYGPVDLCEGSFHSNWAWFSMGHGVNNQHSAFELWTGWSVMTGTSAPRSAALCMYAEQPSSSSARYDILNKVEDGSWQTIFSSNWMGPGQGVGFQTYGPERGRTRIRVTTDGDAHYIFYAGASWGVPQDWLAPA